MVKRNIFIVITLIILSTVLFVYISNPLRNCSKKFNSNSIIVVEEFEKSITLDATNSEKFTSLLNFKEWKRTKNEIELSPVLFFSVQGEKETMFGILEDNIVVKMNGIGGYYKLPKEEFDEIVEFIKITLQK